MPTATELRELEDDELEVRLLEYRRELLNLRFQSATGQLDDYSRLQQARRNVARVLTVLRDREIALAEGRDAGPVILERPVRPPRPRRGRAEDDTDAVDAPVEWDEAEGDDEETDEVGGAETDELEDDGASSDIDEEEDEQ